MDKSIIGQYIDLRREVDDLRVRLAQSKLRVKEMEEAGYQEQDSVKGGEGGIQHFRIQGFPYGRYSREKSLMQTRQILYEARMHECEAMLVRVEEYISGVQDSRMRQLLTLRYKDGLSWQKVARRIGRTDTADAIRMEVKRYLLK